MNNAGSTTLFTKKKFQLRIILALYCKPYKVVLH